MDPKQALKDLLAAVDRQDWEQAVERANALWDWDNRCGALPAGFGSDRLRRLVRRVLRAAESNQRQFESSASILGSDPFSVSLEDLQDHSESNDGLCLACGEWTCGGVEPDAHGYHCESCDQDAVIGAEEALVCGLVVVS